MIRTSIANDLVGVTILSHDFSISLAHMSGLGSLNKRLFYVSWFTFGLINIIPRAAGSVVNNVFTQEFNGRFFICCLIAAVIAEHSLIL